MPSKEAIGLGSQEAELCFFLPGLEALPLQARKANMLNQRHQNSLAGLLPAPIEAVLLTTVLTQAHPRAIITRQ